MKRIISDKNMKKIELTKLTPFDACRRVKQASVTH